MAVQVAVFEGAQAGEVQGQVVFMLLLSVEQAAPGHLPHRLQQRPAALVQLGHVLLGCAGAHGQDVSHDLRAQVGEVKEGVPFAAIPKRRPKDA